MKTLTERLKHIVEEAKKIHSKYLKDYNLTIDYINIFSVDSKEYVLVFL